MQRKKRNFTSNTLCPIGKTEEEYVTHALRDCPASQDVWKLLINPWYWPKFFRGNIVDWFNFNRNKEIGKLVNLNWIITSGEAVRKLWLRRNAFIFRNTECVAEDLYWAIIIAAREFEDSIGVFCFSNLNHREIRIEIPCSFPTEEQGALPFDRGQMEEHPAPKSRGSGSEKLILGGYLWNPVGSSLILMRLWVRMAWPQHVLAWYESRWVNGWLVSVWSLVWLIPSRLRSEV